jgi:hypothetical protein
MQVLDFLVAMALAGGGLLGARRGLWSMAAGGTAVALGAAAGWASSDVLAAALRDWGVGPPGDALLGFLLPFALTSVYARFIIGLWLARKLEGRAQENRMLGAAAGVVWMLFVAGFACRAMGVSPREDGERPFGLAREAGPLSKWLARYPGELGARIYLAGLERPARGKKLAGVVKDALDCGRARERAARADRDARASFRKGGFVRLRIDAHAGRDD